MAQIKSKKKQTFSQIKLIAFSCLIVPIILGVGYSAWTDELSLNTFIETGFINAEFVDGSESKIEEMSLQVREEAIIFEDLLSDSILKNLSIIPTDEEVEYEYDEDDFDVVEESNFGLVLIPKKVQEAEVKASIIISCGSWEKELIFTKKLNITESEPVSGEYAE